MGNKSGTISERQSLAHPGKVYHSWLPIPTAPAQTTTKPTDPCTNALTCLLLHLVDDNANVMFPAWRRARKKLISDQPQGRSDRKRSPTTAARVPAGPGRAAEFGLFGTVRSLYSSRERGSALCRSWCKAALGAHLRSVSSDFSGSTGSWRDPRR